MEGIDVIRVIKSKAVDPKGMAAVFSDRIFVEPTDSKWKDFPAVCMPKAFLGDFERTKNFKIYEDDVWLIGFPRSGTTLVQEMIWLIMNDYNYEEAKKVDTYIRVQWFDFFNVTHSLQGVDVDYQDRMPRPRIFKTHYPVQLLPDQIWTVKPKIIHIVRDIKDVAISYYYLRKNQWHEDFENIEEHFEDILNDRAWYCPYRQHTENYKKIPNYPQIFYMTYEKLMADKHGVTRSLAEFLEKPITDEQLDQLLDYCRFEKMKENKAANMTKYLELFNQLSNHDRPTTEFVRKGIVGDHKNQMREEIIKRFDEWMRPRRVYNIEDISIKGSKKINFSTQHDHSKWMVSNDNSLICVGDINRQEHQKVRGGGTVCIELESVAKVYSQSIVDSEPCTKRNRHFSGETRNNHVRNDVDFHF